VTVDTSTHVLVHMRAATPEGKPCEPMSQCAGRAGNSRWAVKHSVATRPVAELVAQPLRSWVRIKVLLAFPFSTVVRRVRAKKFPIVDGTTACTLLCTGALITCAVQSRGRCQPRFACLDFADLTQSGWIAALGFNSLSL